METASISLGYKEMSVVAIIPARGNSKRLPGKNIRELDGRPLIAYSCLVAQACNTIDLVVVTSDSKDILEEAAPYATIISLPKEYTTDSAPLTETLQYIIEYFNWYDWVVLLQPTCPLRQPSLVDKWIREVEGKDVDGVVSVDIENYKLGTRAGNLYSPSYVPMVPKALIQPQMRENGVLYVFKTANVLSGFPFTYRMVPVQTPKYQSLANIDTQEDWDLMEHFYYTQGYKEMFDQLDPKASPHQYLPAMPPPGPPRPLYRSKKERKETNG